jgi:hypothetical protein
MFLFDGLHDDTDPKFLFEEVFKSVSGNRFLEPFPSTTLDDMFDNCEMNMPT